MSYGEVSSIKPKIKVIKDRNGNNKKQVQVIDQPDKPEPIKFKYSTASYDSYAQEGFQPPLEWDRSDAREREFLNKVNLDYGPVKVTITRMIRLKAPDYSTEKEERKEYLTFESEANTAADLMQYLGISRLTSNCTMPFWIGLLLLTFSLM